MVNNLSCIRAQPHTLLFLPARIVSRCTLAWRASWMLHNLQLPTIGLWNQPPNNVRSGYVAETLRLRTLCYYCYRVLRSIVSGENLWIRVFWRQFVRKASRQGMLRKVASNFRVTTALITELFLAAFALFYLSLNHHRRSRLLDIFQATFKSKETLKVAR